VKITLETKIDATARSQQAASLFDLSAGGFSTVSWNVNLPLDDKPWNIGLITGPSGAGKSTVARHLFPAGESHLWNDDLRDWPKTKSILDGFPDNLGVREITATLCAVGFSSPPAWLRPYRALSTGQQFRADLARLLATAGAACAIDPEDPAPPPPTATSPIAVCDEFTSVVDRTVARVGSAAVAKAIRARNLKFVAVSCHDDVTEWLQPDWVYRPDANSFAWRSLQRRPPIHVTVARTATHAWPLFAAHHYLTQAINRSSRCLLATVAIEGFEPRVAAFSAWLPFLGPGRPAKREHRTVVLPDFQGCGVGSTLADTAAAAFKALGYEARSTTTHPSFIASRRKSPNWTMTRAPSLALTRRESSGVTHATTRLTAGFRYIGGQLSIGDATRLVG